VSRIRLAVALVALLGVAVAAFIALRDGGDESAASGVPAVVGLDEDSAEARLVEDGYSTQIVRRNDPRREGTVVAQQPQAGRQIAPGTVVVLVVSSGAEGGTETGTRTDPGEPVTVPKVTSTHHILAGAKLEELGLVADSAAVADDAECGTVLGQEPAAGTRMRAGQHVRLTVSIGRDPRPEVQIPGLSGPAAAARAAAREFGFTVRTVEQATNSQEVGLVIRQTPAALTRARELTQITLYVGR
jgi:beta-lactam-binding protein with PASTA domain